MNSQDNFEKRCSSISVYWKIPTVSSFSADVKGKEHYVYEFSGDTIFTENN